MSAKSYRDSSLLGNQNLAVPNTSTVFLRKPSTMRTMIMYWTNFVALAQTGQLIRRGHAVKEWQTGNHSCQVSCTPLRVMLQWCHKTVTHIRQGHGPVNQIVLSLQTDPERAPAFPTFLWCAGYSSAVANTCSTVGGTWWLPHLEEAIEVFLGSYKAIVSHLQNSSHKNAKTEGLARAALSANIVVFLLELKVIKIY